MRSVLKDGMRAGCPRTADKDVGAPLQLLLQHRYLTRMIQVVLNGSVQGHINSRHAFENRFVQPLFRNPGDRFTQSFVTAIECSLADP